MELENLLFYNLGDLETIPGLGKNGLVRIPADVRNTLNERARFIGMDSVGIEAQFVTDAPNIDIYLTVQKPEFTERGFVRIYKGNFLVLTAELEPGKTHFLRVNPPPAFAAAKQNMLASKGFSPDVWRIVCDRTTVVLHGINTHGHGVRPPLKEELPRLDWLAYGSSITNSSLNGYPFIAARNLGVQVQNKGFSGSCHIEQTLVDYMFDQCSFDFITCELGINMRAEFSPEDFEKRVRYLVERITESQKPAALITIFPNSKTEMYTEERDISTIREAAYNQILEDIVMQTNSQKLTLIHGHEVLTDVSGLSADLIHPTEYGHAVMGLNLARIIEKTLALCKINI